MEDNSTTENLYETLGIPKSATADEIKKVCQNSMGLKQTFFDLIDFLILGI